MQCIYFVVAGLLHLKMKKTKIHQEIRMIFSDDIMHPRLKTMICDKCGFSIRLTI